MKTHQTSMTAAGSGCRRVPERGAQKQDRAKEQKVRLTSYVALPNFLTIINTLGPMLLLIPEQALKLYIVMTGKLRISAGTSSQAAHPSSSKSTPISFPFNFTTDTSPANARSLPYIPLGKFPFSGSDSRSNEKKTAYNPLQLPSG